MFTNLHTGRTLTLLLLFLGAILLFAGCDLFDDEPGGPERPTVSIYAEGLVAPIGIEVDRRRRLWVAEQGTGHNDSRISVVMPSGRVHPFLTGLPSEIIQGDPIGAVRPYLDDGTLLFFQGEGSDELSMSLLSIDASHFTPNDPPKEVTDVEQVADIGDFVLSERLDFTNSNPYAMAIGPDGDQFIVDAGANAVLRRDPSSGQLSVFARFADLSNPTNVGPPTIDAVPTGIVFREGRFYVSALTGFPFPEGLARIYEIDLQGNVAVHKKGFTALVDVALDPRDGELLVLQIARFRFNPAPGFQPHTGQLLKVHDGTIDTLVSGLNFSSGMHPRAPKEVFVSSLADGEILRIALPKGRALSKLNTRAHR